MGKYHQEEGLMEGQGIPITSALHEIILQIKHPLKHTFLAWLKITHDFFLILISYTYNV